MNNLEKLQEAIYNASPRLKDDAVGQRYKRHLDILHCVFVEDIIGNEPMYYLFDFEERKVSMWFQQEIQNRFEPIGQEIALNDVLEWLNDNDDFTFFCVSTGFICKSPIFEGFTKYEISAIWDLSKPLLKEQSEELINYLCELI